MKAFIVVLRGRCEDAQGERPQVCALSKYAQSGNASRGRKSARGLVHGPSLPEVPRAIPHEIAASGRRPSLHSE